MKSYKTKSPEKKRQLNVNNNSHWGRITKETRTALAFPLMLTSCDKGVNNIITVDSANQSENFDIKYQYFRGSAEPSIVDYNVTVSKNGDTYMGLIKEKKGLLTTNSSIKSDNLNKVFEQISSDLDNEQISENTRSQKDAKIKFAKKVFEENILNADNTNVGKIKIEYKPK